MTGPFREAIRSLIFSGLLVGFVSIGAIALIPKSADAGTSADAARINEDYTKAKKLYQAGKYDEAISLAEQVEQEYGAKFGKNVVHYADIIGFLSVMYYEQGRYAEAEPLFKRTLAIYEKTLGRGDPIVAQTLNNLANLYDSRGRYAEAEPLFKRA